MEILVSLHYRERDDIIGMIESKSFEDTITHHSPLTTRH